MKKIQFITIFLLMINCHAQTSIENLKGWSGLIPPGTYLKDTDNDLNAFEGTYEYINNGKIFRIHLIKKVMAPYNGHFVDLIIGELEYYENYIDEIVNTTQKLYEYPNDPGEHNIRSSVIIDNSEYDSCADCNPNEIRLGFGMFDTKKGSQGVLRKITVNGNEAIKLYKRSIAGVPRANQPDSPPLVPDGEYIMIKIP